MKKTDRIYKFLFFGAVILIFATGIMLFDGRSKQNPACINNYEWDEYDSAMYDSEDFDY